MRFYAVLRQDILDYGKYFLQHVVPTHRQLKISVIPELWYERLETTSNWRSYLICLIFRLDDSVDKITK